ncbi:MAG: glycosyltransferase family 87 protein [Bacteroidales bacterium]
MQPFRILRDWRFWLAVLLIVTAVVSFRVKVGRRMPDFDVYRTAGSRAIAGEPLYQESDGHWQFKYLPAFAFAIAPMSLVPLRAARIGWFAFSIGLLIALLTLSLRLLPDRRARAGAIVGLTILALGKFYAHELELGQTNIMLAVFVLLALSAWRAGREATAGALLAAATIVKPYAILFLPYLVARRRGRAVAGFAAVLLAALLLPAVRYGVGGNIDLLAGWWHTVTASTPPNVTVSDNISIAAMYSKWLGIGPLASWLATLTALLLVAACARVLLIEPRVAFPEYLDAALLLTLIPLLSPQGWDYVLLLATLAVMVLVNHLRGFSPPLRWLALVALLVPGLTLWDVVGRRIYTLFMVSSVVTLCYLFAIGLLLRLRRQQVA